MNVFERPAGRLSLKGVGAMTIALAVFSACSSAKDGSAIPLGDNALTNDSAVRSLGVTSADFKQISTWGAKGTLAVAQCPPGFKVVAGGSSSNNGSSVGSGYASSSPNGWIVKPESNATALAFATCASRAVAHADFRWRSGLPTSGIAAAQCRTGYTLVTGYGMGTTTASWFDPNTNTFWVAGGGVAYASCVRSDAGVIIKHAWNQSQNPKSVYAGCGTGYTVIGGSMGDNAWPGPPLQEHPGVQSNPGVSGSNGWWTFSKAMNELTWAACVSK
jgi:hypothetical protein